MLFHRPNRSRESQRSVKPLNPPARRNAARPRLEALDERVVPAFLDAVTYPFGSYLGPMLAADFNNDGVQDLSVANSNAAGDSFVSVLLGNDDGTFAPAINSASPGALSLVAVDFDLAAVDFDGDGNLDLAAVGIPLLLGNGDGTFRAAGFVLPGYLPGDIQSGTVADFNGDGTLDLGVVSNQWDPDIGSFGWAHVLVGNGDGGFSGPNTTDLGFGWPTAATAANLNGDGFDDLLTLDGGLRVLLGDSSGYLQDYNSFYTGLYSLSVATGDLDADGDTDVVTDGVNTVSVLLGDGQGNFGAAHYFSTGDDPNAVVQPNSVVLGDFTGDGKLDIATIARSHLSVLAGRGDGTFAPPLDSAVGGYARGVTAADFNGDGWLDAATTNDFSNDVSVLINDRAWVPANAPSVNINDVTVTEGNTGTAGATLSVNLSSAYGLPVTVAWATADGSAAAGSDYQSISGTLTFAPGETSKTVTVPVLGDRVAEPNETFLVHLGGATNATISDGQGVGTILDDEPRISISDVAKREGRKNLTSFAFTVTLSVTYNQPVTVSFQTVNGTATTGDNDYVARTGTLTFAPGETTKTITVEVKGDNRREANETFFVDLFGNSGNALLADSGSVGTIINDD